MTADQTGIGTGTAPAGLEVQTRFRDGDDDVVCRFALRDGHELRAFSPARVAYLAHGFVAKAGRR